MPGNDHNKAAGLRGLLAYQWAHPGKQLLFMGQEFGQRAEWSEERGVDWYQLSEQSFSTGISSWCTDINALLPQPPGAVVTRHRARRLLLDRRQRLGEQRAELPAVRRRRRRPWPACSTSPANEHAQYRPGPAAGRAPGARCSTPTPPSTTGRASATWARWRPRAEPWHGRPASAVMALPPLAALWFELDRNPARASRP